ncbi:hypothetical protein, partial [Vibrio mediterranei]|uniref:hypothetical protein n=1 Tax=Vibrio mediterranei TaxID=689 RepID=UPI001EFE9818
MAAQHDNAFLNASKNDISRTTLASFEWNVKELDASIHTEVFVSCDGHPFDEEDKKTNWRVCAWEKSVNGELLNASKNDISRTTLASFEWNVKELDASIHTEVFVSCDGHPFDEEDKKTNWRVCAWEKSVNGEQA